MILADTSIWVDHLRARNQMVAELLDAGMILGHPFVTGEIALGNLHRRDTLLDVLSELPQASIATNNEVLRFINRHALFGRGIGYVDAHLLASVQLEARAELWTRDKRLHGVAEMLGLARV
jgi:predicted nucleic acid-binding protein